jgi:hypothetical protein
MMIEQISMSASVFASFLRILDLMFRITHQPKLDRVFELLSAVGKDATENDMRWSVLVAFLCCYPDNITSRFSLICEGCFRIFPEYSDELYGRLLTCVWRLDNETVIRALSCPEYLNILRSATRNGLDYEIRNFFSTLSLIIPVNQDVFEYCEELVDNSLYSGTESESFIGEFLLLMIRFLDSVHLTRLTGAVLNGLSNAPPGIPFDAKVMRELTKGLIESFDKVNFDELEIDFVKLMTSITYDPYWRILGELSDLIGKICERSERLRNSFRLEDMTADLGCILLVMQVFGDRIDMNAFVQCLLLKIERFPEGLYARQVFHTLKEWLPSADTCEWALPIIQKGVMGGVDSDVMEKFVRTLLSRERDREPVLAILRRSRRYAGLVSKLLVEDETDNVE